MVRSYSAFSLTREHVPLVFPLVHAVAPDIGLDRWQSFAHTLVERAGAPSGAIGLRNGAGYICGLLIFRSELDLHHGQVLAIDQFIALDLVNDEEAARALMQAAEVKARELRCGALHIRLNVTQKNLAHRLAEAGHRSEAVLFCKKVEEAPALS